MVLKRVGPVSLAKILGTLYGLLGLVLGAIFSLVSLLVTSFRPAEGMGPFAAIFGLGAILWLPIFYGGLGFVVALIMGGLYNLAAGVVGGIRVELE